MQSSTDHVSLPVPLEDKAPGRSRPRKIKATFWQNRRRTFKSLIIHIPSLVITGFIISLTVRNVFWTRPNDDINTYMNVLQFAAQFHGIMIVASLSAILLHVVHRGLVSEQGLPFGFLSSSFMLASVSYPFRREFWSLPLLYILLFLPMLFLALVSGPASAIIMLPRLEFWPVREHWLSNKGDIAFKVFMAAPDSDIYPTLLTDEHIFPSCALENASLDPSCPSYGMRYWLMNNDFYNFTTPGRSAEPPPIFNRTINVDWLRYLACRPSSSSLRFRSLYTATSMSNFVGRALFGFEDSLKGFGWWAWKIFGVQVEEQGTPTTFEWFHSKDKAERFDLSLRSANTDVPIRKPFVMIECAGYAAENESIVLLHDQMFWPPWNRAPIADAEWRINISEFSSITGGSNSTTVNSSIIDTSRFGDVKPSLGVYYAMPEIVAAGPGCAGCQYNPNTNYSNFVCTVDARWMPSGAFSDASAGERGIFDVNSSSIDAAFMREATRDDLPNIYVSEAWTNAITVPWVDSVLTSDVMQRSMLDIIGQKCLDANTYFSNKIPITGTLFSDQSIRRVIPDPTGILTCLQVNLAITLTEALSRVQDPIPMYFVADARGMPVRNPKTYNADEFLVTDILLPLNDFPQLGPRSNETQWVRNLTMEDFQDSSRFTQVIMPARRWGYGYGFDDDTVLVYVGAAILLLHAAITLLFLIYLLWRGDEKESEWRTVGELVDLALQSGTKDGKESAQIHSGWKNRRQRRLVQKTIWAGKIAVRERAAATADGASDEVSKTLVLQRLESKRDVEQDVDQCRETAQS